MQMMQSSPQFKQLQEVVKFVNQNGGDPEKLFYKLADEQGVNPQDILNELI